VAACREQGANYRLIDIPVSNCINSNVNKIYCLTQFNSASLNRHLSMAYVRALAGVSLTHPTEVALFDGLTVRRL
jgi:ADP-glucose pyrophosphorylase